MAKKEKSQASGRPSVRAQKAPVVHKRRAEQSQHGKSKLVVEAPEKSSVDRPSVTGRVVAKGAVRQGAERADVALEKAERQDTARGDAVQQDASRENAPNADGLGTQKTEALPKRTDGPAASGRDSAAAAQNQLVVGDSASDVTGLEQPVPEKAADEESASKGPTERKAPTVRKAVKGGARAASKGESETAPTDEDAGNAEGEASSAAASEDGGKREKPGKRRRWGLWIGLGIAGVLVVAALVAVGMFSWNRWLRYDDAADMQGTWYAYGTKVPVTFTENAIVFDKDTAYVYEIDPDAKTIRYSIGDMEGQGRYWFSEDRSVLIITDGSGFTKWGTVFDDVGHWWHDLFNGASLPMAEESIAFSRQPMTEVPPAVKPSEGSSSSAASSSADEPAQGSVSEGSSEESSESTSSGDNQESGQQEPSGSETSDRSALGELDVSDIMME